MLEGLKRDILRESNNNQLDDILMESVDSDDIRDTILDDMGFIDETELDEDLGKFIQRIPEYDEEKDLEEKIKNIAESYIPDSFLSTDDRYGW